MQYARLIYGHNEKQLSTAEYCNLGDYFQTFSMDNIYKELGIPINKIHSIDKVQIKDYCGDDIVLPMQGWFGYIKGIELFPLPKTIIPAFLGYHCVTNHCYGKQYLDTYRKYGPVCCRDEATFELMQKHGIEAYLSGCFTITLPKRENVPSGKRVFLVDAPRGIEKYIPKELKEDLVYISHEIPFDNKRSPADELMRLEKTAFSLLKRYKEEAMLVITSRLHCAGPCLGMGIPVILAREYFDGRYGWIDKYLPLYTPKQFDRINWKPDIVDLSEIRPKLIELAGDILFDRDCKTIKMKDIHNYYMDRTRAIIKTPIKTKIYFKMHEGFPKTADFLREKVLKNYSVSTARDKSEV